MGNLDISTKNTLAPPVMGNLDLVWNLVSAPRLALARRHHPRRAAILRADLPALLRMRDGGADIALRHEIRKHEQHAGKNEDQQQGAEGQTLDAENAHGTLRLMEGNRGPNN